MDNSQLLASISTQNTGFSKHIYISSDKRLDIRTMMEKHSCIWFMLGFTTLYQVPFWLLRLEPNQIFQFKLKDCFKIWVNSFSDREKDKSCYFRGLENFNFMLYFGKICWFYLIKLFVRNFPNKIVDKFRFIHFFVFFFNICLFYFVFLQTKL